MMCIPSRIIIIIIFIIVDISASIPFALCTAAHVNHGVRNPNRPAWPFLFFFFFFIVRTCDLWSSHLHNTKQWYSHATLYTDRFPNILFDFSSTLGRRASMTSSRRNDERAFAIYIIIIVLKSVCYIVRTQRRWETSKIWSFFAWIKSVVFTESTVGDARREGCRWGDVPWGSLSVGEKTPVGRAYT